MWGKHTIFERALKSAFIVKIPGKTKGNTIDKIVSTVDIYPTLMDLCNVEMPHKTDGKSMLPLITNPFAEWEEASYGYFRNGITLRTERYRLTRYFRDAEPVVELYDHQTDPNETENVAETYSETVEKLMPLWQKGNTGLFE